MRMRFSGISGCLSAAVLALGVGGAPVVQADALGDSLEQAHIRKATFAAPAWEGYTNAAGSGLYWDLLKQVYAPYGLDVKFINMPWNRANKLMTAGSMVDGVPGEIPGVEGKLYAQLPIDIEYHGVMHAAKTPFSGRASLTGKRVGWRHSYNLIPAEQRDFTLVECVRPERCTEQVQNGELDFFLDEPDELEKQRSEAHLPADAYPIAQLPPGKESFMTFADSASGRLLREVYDARVRQMAASGELRALYQRWNSEVPGAVQALSAQ
ncbi:ABC transporter substrate-binding protein [Pseudomonas aeruginosa]|nr:ABC transporter substrate-binding protein [Pseudomonas aeruginosa]MCT0385190.1 ABC transporter substrate-binding protein [Pseudomonas aeruginosa]HBP6026816.1 ABC transporter substrate-binding protein [Pseudomonas aeruginosa]